MRGKIAASVAHLDWELIHDKFTHTLASVIAVHENRNFDQQELVVASDEVI